MANKETNNFKAALNELLSGKIATEDKKPPLFKEPTFEAELKNEIDEILSIPVSQQPAPAAPSFEPLAEIEYEEIAVETIAAPIDDIVDNREYPSIYASTTPEIAKPVYEPVSQVSVIAMEQAVSVNQETVIAKDVVIEGNIRSNSKLKIVGEVTGDVKATADVVIEGKVGGSIQGTNVFLCECEVNNSVSASNEVTITERSMVNGDIKAGSIVSNGVVNGNIDAQNVTLNSASRTIGDVKCKLIKIGEGAGLKGKLETVE